MQTELRGLVLRVVDIRESDRLLTLYTDKLGVITVLARGARSVKSRKMPATCQFCYSEFVISGNADKLTVNEASVIETFFGLRDSLDALSLAGYVCEVIAECGTAEPDGELMRLGLNTLYALSKGSYSVPLVKAAFEIRCASILGFMPDIFGCHRCGREDGAMFYLDIMAGAVECYECHKLAEGKKELLSEVHEAHLLAVLSPAVRRALEYCVCCPPEKLFSFKLTEEDTELLSVAAERYLLNHLERGFRSLDFYNEVKA